MKFNLFDDQRAVVVGAFATNRIRDNLFCLIVSWEIHSTVLLRIFAWNLFLYFYFGFGINTTQKGSNINWWEYRSLTLLNLSALEKSFIHLCNRLTACKPWSSPVHMHANTALQKLQHINCNLLSFQKVIPYAWGIFPYDEAAAGVSARSTGGC